MTLLETKNIYKRFAGVNVLKDIDFNLKKDEIHGLIGENGAGKSTLLKIISGIYHPEEGEIMLNNKSITIENPKDAIDMGISMIHQELSLCPHLSVAENILMGRLPEKKRGFIDWKEMSKEAKDILDKLGFDIDTGSPINQLSVAQKQMIEIAKAISRNAKILLMDEPTSALTPAEIKNLFKLIKQLKEKGLTIVYISHKLEEIIEITERITILRDGKIIDTLETGKTNMEELTKLMIGRSVSEFFGEDEHYSEKKTESKHTIIEVKNLNRSSVLKDINFKLMKGEILGVYGLMGSGRTELLRAIYGADEIESGEIIINSVKTSISSPSDAIKYGISLIPEERKLHGLFLDLSVTNNLTIATLENICKASLFINKKQEIDITNNYIKTMSIKTSSADNHLRYLSGGNQQKVVISRWLASKCKVFLLDEPTRGIDVGSKSEIYSLIKKLSLDGYSIILVSSELSEIIKLSHRVLLMNKGHIIAELMKENINTEKIAEIIAKHTDVFKTQNKLK